MKKRQSTWWSFIWGFIIFAMVAFFVELVAYLPSCGGYAYYLVGIAVTVLIGRQAIIALNRYLESQNWPSSSQQPVRPEPAADSQRVGPRCPPLQAYPGRLR